MLFIELDFIIISVLFCRCQAKGFEAGYEVGQQSGYEEGYKLGWEKGSSIASEVHVQKIDCWLLNFYQ